MLADRNLEPRLTREDIALRHEAMLYISERLSQAEWSRDPVAPFLLRREFSHALSEILEGEHLPCNWTFA